VSGPLCKDHCEDIDRASINRILPNGWSPDNSNEALVKDIFIFKPFGLSPLLCLSIFLSIADRRIVEEHRKLIRDLGKSSYISVITGFWYEWSLTIPPAFGFDIPNCKATFFDEGETKMPVSTWPQVNLPPFNITTTSAQYSAGRPRSRIPPQPPH
jgi:hypothetical protein